MPIEKPKTAKDRIILALDVNTIDEVKKYVELLKDYVGCFKVGLQLYTACGFEPVKIIKDNGCEVYFDGKFQDIPNTVAHASVNLIKNGINYFDICATGGSKMMSNTVKLCREYSKKMGIEPPTILSVTLLSSYGQRTLTEELNIYGNISDYVLKLAEMSRNANVDGVVATANDAMRIKKELGEDFIVVCPAIRPTWSVVNDQIRVVSPTDAINSGVDYMIIGRPITSATNPVDAAKLIINEIQEAVENLNNARA